MENTSFPTLEDHYSLALGLRPPWRVTGVALDVKAQTLDISVAYEGADAPCPACAATCAVHSLREERGWRHLDMMQFATTIRARTPRTACAAHGVKTMRVPWADAHSRFTILFERFAVEVLQATTSVTQAQALLRLGWDAVQRIRERAVERGLSRRDADDGIPRVGIDEKSFLKGHRYATLATDLDRGRVLDAVEHRTLEAAAAALNKAIPESRRPQVEAGAMDMWEPFMTAWTAVFPHAPIVHDRFHVAGYLGKAVDAVRRKEHRALKKDGSDLLTGAKYIFLKNADSHTDEERERFRSLMRDGLKTGRAWALKDAFRRFFDYVDAGAARRFFDRWYFRATHSRLRPMIDVARTLKRHLAGLLAHCAHRITNAVTEGLNSKIQSVKANARGFRTFEHYRIAILFHCGKLSMLP